MKEFFALVFGLIFILVVAIGIGYGGQAAGLWFMPWFLNQQTKITRVSNGYVTSQVEALRELHTKFYQTTNSDQKNAIFSQMCGIEDQIPTYAVPQDIQFFLSSRC